MAAMEITRSFILKPSASPSSPSQPHRSLDQHVPLSIFDRAAFNLNVPILYVFLAPMPDNAAMVEGLAKALFHFPHLAGRMSADHLGRPSILLNDAGARVIETRVDSTLREMLPIAPSSDLAALHPATEGVDELLQVQLNRYACGGAVVGLTAHHRVGDGQSMNTFFTAWARLVRGLELDPPPYHDREAIALPRNPRRVEFNHRAVEFRESEAAAGETPAAAAAEETPNVVVRYSAEFLEELKRRFQSGNPERRCSTFQCLLAHVWRKVTAARGLAGGEATRVRVAVNGRTRMKPRVAMEYFGNLVLWAYPKMTAGELLGRSYGGVADAIHAAVSTVDDGYFKSFVDFGAAAAEEVGAAPLEATAPAAGNSLSPDMEVDSWLSFAYHELDFGGGGPVQVLTYLPIEGLGIFLPSPEEKGAVDFHVALLPGQVSAFMDIAHRLD